MPSIPPPSPALIAAAKKTFLAIAHCDQVAVVVKKIQDQLFREETFEDPVTGQRLALDAQTYRLDDAHFGRYLTSLQTRYHAAGFPVRIGECPLSMAGYTLRMATRELIRASQELGLPYNPTFIQTTPRFASDYTALLLGFLAPYVQASLD